MKRFDAEWAQRLEALLGADGRYATASALLAATVRLGSPREGVDILVDPSGTRVVPAAPERAPDFGVEGAAEAWEELFHGPRVTLVQCVRQGSLHLSGDAVQAMLWWKPLFLIAEAGRTISGEERCRT